MDKPKKKWYKRWWAITIWIFLGLAFLAALTPETPKTNTQPATQPDQTLTPTSPEATQEKTKETSAIPQKVITSTKDADERNTTYIAKSLVEMLPKREDIPTEFKMDSPHNMTLREIPEGFDSAVKIESTKIVGSTGLIELNFNIIKFDSEENARKYHVDDTNRIKNEGGYTEIDIKVPSKAECFSFTEDYGYQGRFATSDCLKGNLEYQVLVTAAYTFEKPNKYLKDMITLLDNKINK